MLEKLQFDERKIRYMDESSAETLASPTDIFDASPVAGDDSSGISLTDFNIPGDDTNRENEILSSDKKLSSFAPLQSQTLLETKLNEEMFNVLCSGNTVPDDICTVSTPLPEPLLKQEHFSMNERSLQMCPYLYGKPLNSTGHGNTLKHRPPPPQSAQNNDDGNVNAAMTKSTATDTIKCATEEEGPSNQHHAHYKHHRHFEQDKGLVHHHLDNDDINSESSIKQESASCCLPHQPIAESVSGGSTTALATNLKKSTLTILEPLKQNICRELTAHVSDRKTAVITTSDHSKHSSCSSSVPMVDGKLPNVSPCAGGLLKKPYLPPAEGRG